MINTNDRQSGNFYLYSNGISYAKIDQSWLIRKELLSQHL